MPKRWLFKTEPDNYSYADLERDGQTSWDGLKNALALQNLRQCRPGDLAFIYHTGKEKAIIGIAKIASDPYPDPEQDDAKWAVVDVAAVQPLPRPVTLKEVKATSALADWQLATHSRLGAMPVTAAQWRTVERMARRAP